ncbi:hypothetical protein IGJ02_003145 [Enterococcus sp. DIV0724b]|uniref:DUF6287 domain-containing protein n=1 Tax=Enterococcus sp. DIV0724b TaxID=2774694 RepID=UPI003D3009E0
MKKIKSTILLGLSLVFLGVLVGCNNSGKSSVDTVTISSSSRETTELTTNMKETKETKETTEQTTTQSSIVQETKETDASQEQAREEQANEAIESMNLSQIQQGDFTSLNGTWVNGLGNTIFVENATMSFTDISNQKQAGEITGLNVDIPNLNSADGTPNLVSYMGDSNKVKSYEQQLGLEENQGFISLRSNLPGAVIYVSFLPKGVMGDIIEGDISSDKIVAVGTQNTATSVRAEYVYYKAD